MKAVALGCLLLVLANDAWAHRLDEYLQATLVSVTTNRIDVDIDLTPGVAIASQLLRVIDTDGDGRISEREVADYAQRVRKDVQIGLDEKALPLRVLDATFPSPEDIRAGLGVIRIKLTAPIGRLAAGPHALSLTNSHLPKISVYLVNALMPEDRAITIKKQTRDELQRHYRLEFGMN